MNLIPSHLRRAACGAALSAMLASAALAATDSTTTFQGGLNLSWDDCGKAGQANRDFACASDSSSNVLVASFVAPKDLADYLGLSAWITVSTRSALPDWWKHGKDMCRGRTGLTSGFDFTSKSACADFFGGAAYGGHEFLVGSGGVNRVRIALQCAVSYDSRGPIAGGKEYYAFSLRLASSVADSCQGCKIPACITLDEIQLFQPAMSGFDPVLSAPVTRSHVTWQGGPEVCPGTPAVSRNWGRVGTIHR